MRLAIPTTIFVIIGIAAMFAFKARDGEIYLKNCTEKETVVAVSNCSSSGKGIDCTIQTDRDRAFRSDLRHWPGSMLQIGDKIFYCTRASQVRDINRVNCKNDMCY